MVKKANIAAIAVIVLLSAFSFQPGVTEAASKVEGLITEARSHIGTPYQWGGTTPSGFDCSGFMGYVFKKAGVNLPRTAAQQYRVGTAVSKSDLQKGDIVFFTHGSGIQHNGLYIGNGKFIHASTSKGVIVSSVNDPYYWGDRYVGAKRVLENERQAEEAVKSQEMELLDKGEYYDVKEDYWAYNSITELSKEDVVKGYSDSTFRPSNNITRAEAASYLVEALNLPLEESNIEFNDVNKNTEHAKAIQAVSKAGIINGDSNKNFMPDEALTRKHMAVIFYRAFNLEGITYEKSFTDVSEDHTYAKHIDALAGSGITTGNADGEFEPERETTRAHFAVFLERALQ